MRKPEKLEELLHAANQVVMRDGIARLTLELVAKEAGVSKGAVLYYFPTKNALIGAMLETYLDWHFAAWQEAIDREPEGPGRALRALLRCSVAPDEMDRRGGAGMLAAVANDAELLGIIRRRVGEWNAILADDGIDPTTTMLIRLVIDGLKFCDLLDITPPTDERRRAVIEALIDLVTPTETSDR